MIGPLVPVRNTPIAGRSALPEPRTIPDDETVTSRQLVILGSSSQVPTRDRAQNGYAVQWDEQLFLFDPGEGFHRQTLLAGVAISRANALFISHFHGDHCLGLPGLIHRRLLEPGVPLLPTFYPSEGEGILDMLMHASFDSTPPALELRPVMGSGSLGHLGDLEITAARLEHPAPTYGYRISEVDSIGFDARKLKAAGLTGKAVGDLERDGKVMTPQGRLHRADFEQPRPGQSIAFVMDTAFCDAALTLAHGVDLLICEATFLESDRRLADESGHMTARDAGRLASEAGARRVVLSHFSARYSDAAKFGEEAGELHPDVVVARDLARIPFPLRVPRGKA